MKNRHYEKLRANARRHRVTRPLYKGVYVYHCYDEKRELSYWDDCGFRLGKYWIAVWWTHPRYTYEETCRDVAYELANAAVPDRPKHDLFANNTPIYKKLGKNKRRKKVSMWQMANLPESETNFFALWDQFSKQVRESGELTTRAKFSVKQYNWCRGVEICAPIEVLCEDDLVKLCELVRDCLKDPHEFNRRFGDYSYGAADWLRENPENARQFTDHGVK